MDGTKWRAELPDEEIVIPEIDKGGHKSYCI